MAEAKKLILPKGICAYWFFYHVFSIRIASPWELTLDQIFVFFIQEILAQLASKPVEGRNKYEIAWLLNSMIFLGLLKSYKPT